MSEVQQISQLQMTGLLARLFRVPKAGKLYDVTSVVDEVDAFHLPFSLTKCSFVPRRMGVVSGVSRCDTKFTSFPQDFVDDSENGLVLVSDQFRNGAESLFVVSVGDHQTVRTAVNSWYRHLDRITSNRVLVVGERPSSAAAAVQLLSLVQR